MAEERFYSLAGPSSSSRDAWWVEGEVDWAQITCPLDDWHRGAGPRLGNLSVYLPNRPVHDFVWTFLSECLIQDHVLSLFKSHGFTGFDVRPVKAQFEKPAERPPPLLWELVVLGWGGMAAKESGIKLIGDCKGCGHLVYSEWTNPAHLIDISQWDGNDVFMVWPLPRYLLVTRRVVTLIRQSRLTGAIVTPLVKLHSHLSGVRSGFSPGRLSHWMPEERARRLGEPLGIY